MIFKAMGRYFLAVFIFGSFFGLGALFDGVKSNTFLGFIVGYLMMAYLWGALILNGLIVNSNIRPNQKVFRILLLALFAAVLATITVFFLGIENRDNLVLFDIFDNSSTYGPIPVKAHELIGFITFLLYVLFAFCVWVLDYPQTVDD
ncbi:MAG: hypothetical protein DHS20C05_00370 [Hyphococcus sp.]|nr:MAG: hypothetical protein DHS20C05_00370 [Marinicaulis sp.]